MKQTVRLNTTGYDPFITFMKGYAILCVLLAHAIPNPDATGYVFWGGMQVPLFLLIQTFHSFKKKPKLSFTKILKRVVLPFLLVQTCVIALLCKNGDVCNQLKISVIGGARAWCILLLDLLAVCNIAAVSLSTAVKAEEVKSVNPVLADIRGM